MKWVKTGETCYGLRTEGCSAGGKVRVPWIVSGHAVTEQAALTSQMGRFETEVLAAEKNLAALANPSGARMIAAAVRSSTILYGAEGHPGGFAMQRRSSEVKANRRAMNKQSHMADQPFGGPS